MEETIDTLCAQEKQLQIDLRSVQYKIQQQMAKQWCKERGIGIGEAVTFNHIGKPLTGNLYGFEYYPNHTIKHALVIIHKKDGTIGTKCKRVFNPDTLKKL